MLRLKELRLKAGKTQNDIAKLLGVTRPAYTRYENGEREPDLNTIKALADYYQVSVDFLLGCDGDLRTSEDLAFFRKFTELSPPKKKAVLKLIDTLNEKKDV